MINSCKVNINKLPQCKTCLGTGFQLNELICDCCKKELCDTKFLLKSKYSECEKCHGTGKWLFTEPQQTNSR